MNSEALEEMRLYQDMEDAELAERARRGDNDALDFLMSKYKNHVRKKARSYFLIGADRDDLIQEGMIGLYKAIRSYDGCYGRDGRKHAGADIPGKRIHT